jgi:hypothetical protein
MTAIVALVPISKGFPSSVEMTGVEEEKSFGRIVVFVVEVFVILDGTIEVFKWGGRTLPVVMGLELNGVV